MSGLTDSSGSRLPASCAFLLECLLQRHCACRGGQGVFKGNVTAGIASRGVGPDRYRAALAAAEAVPKHVSMEARSDTWV